jgi:hypothetical protein
MDATEEHHDKVSQTEKNKITCFLSYVETKTKQSKKT